MPRRLLLLLTLACVALLATPAQAAELLAVLELSGALPADQRRALTDAVRRTATDSVASAGIKVMTQENMETLLTDMGMDASCISEGACEVDTLRNLQANYGITGEITDFGGTYVVRLQLYEMRGGTMVGAEDAKSKDPLELYDPLVPDATARLLGRLPGVVVPASARLVATPVAPAPVTAVAPSGPSAAELEAERERAAAAEREGTNAERMAKATGEAAEPTIDELLDATDVISRGTSSHGKMVMQVKTDRYERILKMEVWTRGTEDSLVRILEPAFEKGISTLKVGDNIWNYLPAIDRTLKVSDEALSGTWMGSHITNDDLVKQSRMKENYTSTLTSKPAANGKGVYRIELVPRPDAPVVWGKVMVEVRATMQPVAVFYHDKKGELVRTMRFLDIQDMGGRTVPAIVRVEPADKPDEFTEIRYEDMSWDVELSDSIFALQSLKQ